MKLLKSLILILILASLLYSQGMGPGPGNKGYASGTDTFTDNFNDGSIDTGLWASYLSGPDGAFVTVSETTQLELATSGGTFTGTTKKGLVTVTARDMTGRRWKIHRTANTGGNYFEFISIYDGTNESAIAFDAATGNYEAFHVGAYLGDCTGGNYWSIRHDSGTDHIIFETSTDGSSWTQCTGGDVATGAFNKATTKYRLYIMGLTGYNATRTLAFDDASVQ